MEQQGPAVKAQPAVLRMTVEIKRAVTGKVETYELVGTSVEQDEPQQAEKEQQ